MAENTNLVNLPVQKSEMGLIEWNSRCWRGCVPSGSSREEPPGCQGACVPWLVATTPVFTAGRMHRSMPFSLANIPLCLPPPLLRALGITLVYPLVIRLLDNPDNLPVLRSAD